MNTLDEPAATPATLALVRTDLPLPGRREGKVRDVYAVPPDPDAPPRVLIIATDRISAFDVVLPTPIPGKGQLLTRISTCWFDFIGKLGVIGDHLLSTDPADVPGLTDKQQAGLGGRIMLGRAAEVIPVEFVVRGYLSGSGWNEYLNTGAVCGVRLPTGLQRCDRLPEPIFTPAMKATEGHDENIDFDRAVAIAGSDVMTRLRDVSTTIYDAAAAHAEARGLILADTKFEFGYALDQSGAPTDEVILIDEALTPDSSRFWPADEYEPGRDQDSFDKQFVRNYLLRLVEAGDWDKTDPGPDLPIEIVRSTIDRYREAGERLFGSDATI